MLNECLVTMVKDETVLIDKGYAVYTSDNIELSYYNTSQRLIAEQQDKTFIYDIHCPSDFAYVITTYDLECSDKIREFFNACLKKFIDPLQDIEMVW